ncbi:hypothetical protein DKX38_009936 [Salix brachista]|uniref:Major facilitator superfamily (MFS) profile domain-containing protein n=1 Tax=Salix brachista TaxID=2182728 RepID=A0A5N5MBY2_9ROSI|nr:hypothetical protein DKX38_009936 [Salix brachista]
MVARILGRLLHMVGVLPTDKVIEVQRTDLVGEFVSHIGPKTRRKIAEAEGGILFVDEAYQLIPSQKEEEKDYGIEALEEIMSDLANICHIKMNNQDESSSVYGFKLHSSCSGDAIAALIERETTEKQRREMNGCLVNVMLANARETLDLRLEFNCIDTNELQTITLEVWKLARKECSRFRNPSPNKLLSFHLLPTFTLYILPKKLVPFRFNISSKTKTRKSHMADTELAQAQEAISPTNIKPHRLNNYALACALLASTNSILLGYDIGVMSGAVLFIKENLEISSTQVEILVGVLNVSSLIGSLASGKTSDYIGRRYTIVLAATTFLIGALLMGLAPSFPFLMAGRVIAGIGVGFSLMIAPVYSAEISPAMARGFLTSLPEVFIVFGILLGYIVNYALSGLPLHINWRLMLGLAAIPSLLIGCGVTAMPESPRWLVMQGRLGDAKQVLIKISDNVQEAGLRLSEITKEASSDHLDSSGAKWHGQGVYKELLLRPSRPVRRMLIAAIGVNFFMQASGNDAVIYYCPEVFKDAGIHSKKMLFGVNVIMGSAKTSFALLSALFLDRFGRRPLLLLGSAGMGLSLAVLAMGSMFLEHSSSKPLWAIVLSVVAVCGVVSFFSIGLGPITWVYSSEIFPLRLRAQGSSLAISVNRLVSGVTSMTFLTISNKITFGGMFFVLSGVMVAATAFFYVFMPETKGKTLEEIGALFEDKNTNSSIDDGREMG